MLSMRVTLCVVILVGLEIVGNKFFLRVQFYEIHVFEDVGDFSSKSKIMIYAYELFHGLFWLTYDDGLNSLYSFKNFLTFVLGGLYSETSTVHFFCLF